MTEYNEILNMLKKKGYTEIQEDIEIKGDLYTYFKNPITKERINLSFEKC